MATRRGCSPTSRSFRNPTRCRRATGPGWASRCSTWACSATSASRSPGSRRCRDSRRRAASRRVLRISTSSATCGSWAIAWPPTTGSAWAITITRTEWCGEQAACGQDPAGYASLSEATGYRLRPEQAAGVQGHRPIRGRRHHPRPVRHALADQGFVRDRGVLLPLRRAHPPLSAALPRRGRLVGVLRGAVPRDAEGRFRTVHPSLLPVGTRVLGPNPRPVHLGGDLELPRQVLAGCQRHRPLRSRRGLRDRDRLDERHPRRHLVTERGVQDAFPVPRLERHHGSRRGAESEEVMCKTLSPTVTLGELMAEKMEIGYLREELALADAEIRRLTALDGHHIL